MAFVTIAGTTVHVLDTTAFEEEVELLGELRRGDDGGFQNSLRTPKRAFALVGWFDPPSDYDTLLAAISTAELGVPTPVTVTSPADGLTRGATLTCLVRMGRGQYKSKGAGLTKTTRFTAPITIREA